MFFFLLRGGAIYKVFAHVRMQCNGIVNLILR